MELLKAIYERRSTRDFTDAEVRRDVVLDLIRAAIQAPSALNEQPWAFAVIHGRERLAKYSKRAKEHLLRTEDPSYGLDPRIDEFDNDAINLFHNADTLIVICATPGRFFPNEDCFLAAQNLMLAAHGVGLGSCPVGSVRSWLMLPEIKAELGIPEHYVPTVAIVVGYPAHPPLAVAKKAPEITSWHWDK